ncbi:MAG: N-acetylmuramoyl-L-alanine amidase [Endomicrobium sp.]|jgi:N-acetylmuramoyl-L-alanine amidase|nr:N-acetylmuramoyl-L-alanine amidase [Endomicrobium sp.]
MKTTKLIKFLILSALIFCPIKSLAAKTSDAPPAEAVNVIVDGEFFPGASVYKITDSAYFFSIKEVAEIYNALLEWKPVSGEVIMLVNNNKIAVKANANSITYGKLPKKTSLPSRLIKNELYIPPEILTSQEFSDATETETVWNKDSLVLTVTHKSNIDAIRYFTRPEITEIVVETKEPLMYTVAKASAAVALTIHRGKIQRDFIYANNGAVRDIVFDSKGKSAEIKINLQQTPLFVKSARFEKPSRIVLDIYHSKKLDISNVGENLISSEETLYEEAPETQASLIEFSQKDGGKNPNSAVSSPPALYNIDEILDVSSMTAETAVGNEDLQKAPVSKFESKNIIDDSYAIIDDENAFASVKEEAKASLKKSARKRIIVIDAGHGGEDPGAIGPNGAKEKDLNLAIAHRLKDILDKDDNYETVLTRKDDVFIPLAERTNIANENNADLFVSVHCNANFNREVNGFEIYFLSEKATDSEAAATAALENAAIELEGKPTKKRAKLQEMLWSMTVNEYINDSSELCSFVSSETPSRLKIPNRGVKQASFYVLRGAQMPAVLVESAFISNYAEESKLSSSKFQTAVADSIYEGIVKYYARKDKLGAKK